MADPLLEENYYFQMGYFSPRQGMSPFPTKSIKRAAASADRVMRPECARMISCKRLSYCRVSGVSI